MPVASGLADYLGDVAGWTKENGIRPSPYAYVSATSATEIARVGSEDAWYLHNIQYPKIDLTLISILFIRFIYDRRP